MPYISLNVSPRLEERQKEQLKRTMGKTIALIPGKTEAVTMVGINDGCALYLGGESLENGAFIEIRLLGEAEKHDKENLTKAVFAAMGEELSMKDSDIYVNLLEMDSWGSGGKLKQL